MSFSDMVMSEVSALPGLDWPETLDEGSTAGLPGSFA